MTHVGATGAQSLRQTKREPRSQKCMLCRRIWCLAKTVGSSLATKVESELALSLFVLDCLILAAGVFADEASAEADKLLEQVAVAGAIAPSILSFEITNVLI